MFKNKAIILLNISLVLSLITSCDDISTDFVNSSKEESNNVINSNSESSSTISSYSEVSSISEYQLESSSDNKYIFTNTSDSSDSVSFEATLESGSNCILVSNDTITFKNVSKDTIYSLRGTFYGNIVIEASDSYEFELDLEGFNLYSNKEVPIYFTSASEATICAKSGTTNLVYDLRDEVDEDGTSASIYATCDINLKGNGSLAVISNNNNGIHSKDNLKVKNLTLDVECNDNALKGNDKLTIESGNITLKAKKGDGIKTKNSHISEKGKQKGDVYINGGNINIYAACDGIDAAHDLYVNEDSKEVNLKIYTDKYSPYSLEVENNKEDVMYVSYSYTTYKYSIEYSNDNNETVWYNSSSYETNSYGRGYYYPITKPSGYSKMRLFIYTSSMVQGQSTNYFACSDYITINDAYDTISLQARNNELRLSWSNYSSSSSNYGPGGMGGPQGMGGQGGMQEGNSDKGDYSTKGLKASNEIQISKGNITIYSYDDGIHANNDDLLGEDDSTYYGTGNVTISGGNIIVESNDDGVHADGTLTVSGGTIKINKCYEGLEGNTIVINDGNVSVISSDDGFNSTATSGVGMEFNGGTIYIYAQGDGIDSNTKTSYQGFVFNGSNVVVISNSQANSSLDSEQGYTYTSGNVVAIGLSGGMSSESKNAKNFSSVGTSKTISLSKDKYLVVKNVATIKMPVSISALVVVLGNSNASISSSSSENATLDDNGVYWN